jgi:hypothetical protein
MMQRILYLTIAGLMLEATDAPVARSVDVAPRAQGTVKHEADPHPNAPIEARTGNPLWRIPIRQLSATWDRPVFSPSRRPPPPPPVAAPAVAFVPPPPKPAAPPKPPLDLIGTVIGEHDRLAVFVEPDTKRLVRLRLDEPYEGWIVRSIQHRETTFQHDRITAVVALPPPSTPTPPFAVPPNGSNPPPGPPPVATRPVLPGVAAPRAGPKAPSSPSRPSVPDAASQGLATLFGRPPPLDPSPPFDVTKPQQVR